MTLDDLLAREAIRQTVAAYTMAGDRLQDVAFAAVFTEDGVLETEFVAEADRFRHQGRAAIGQWIRRWRELPKDVARIHGASFVRHHLSTCQIELTGPLTAKARIYWVAYTDQGPDHCGCYLDDYRKEGGSWLIAHRRIREDWRAPDSLFTGAIEKSR